MAGHDSAVRRFLRRLGTWQGLVELAWSLALGASLAVASLQMHASRQGQVILWLIACGFLLFAVARGSVAPLYEPPGSCWPMLRPAMRAVYLSGYALMFCGTALTAVIFTSQLRG